MYPVLNYCWAMTQDHLLHKLLPYRMQAVAILNWALDLRATWGEAPMNI